MSPKIRTRLIVLSIGAIAMIALFILSITRNTDQNLPPTPTSLAKETGEEMAALPTLPTPETPTPTPTAKIEPEATAPEPTQDSAAATATQEARIIATAESGMLKATQRARAMSNIVRGLYEDGVVSSLTGIYKKIDDFSTAFNKTGYYQMHYSDYEARYFVIRANLIWDNAGEEVSYPTAGCGLVFGYQDINNHFRTFLNLDGNVRLHRMLEGEFTLASTDYVGTLKQPSGHANMILAVDQDWVTIYIDNQQITRFFAENITEGDLAYAIAAGSNIDYGTSCEFKDIELWIFE